jgi:hypothetical protein
MRVRFMTFQACLAGKEKAAHVISRPRDEAAALDVEIPM